MIDDPLFDVKKVLDEWVDAEMKNEPPMVCGDCRQQITMGQSHVRYGQVRYHWPECGPMVERQ